MADESVRYAARLEVDYPDQLNRLTSFLRAIWIIPIGVIAWLVSTAGSVVTVAEAGEIVERTGGIGGSLAMATALLILFRRQYPRWWFEFVRELFRFQGRVGAYAALLTDRYPSTVDEQAVHLDIDYPGRRA